MRTDAIVFIISLMLTSGIVLTLGATPFIYDEGSYAMMVHEFSKDPGMVMPTIAGEHVEWKPPLFTWIYTPFYMVLSNLGLPMEAAFRLPSALFASLSVALVYRIGKRLYGEKVGIAGSALFLASPLLLFSSSFIMMEAFSVFLILASIDMHMEKRFIPGMLLMGMLVLTKWLYVIAPLVFITLYFIKDRGLPKLLLSYLIVPISILLYLILVFFFSDMGNALTALGLDTSRTIPHFDVFRAGLFMVIMLYTTFPLSIFFAFFAIFGKVGIWEERHTIALGALAFLVPFAQYFIYWYAIISVPAMAIFVARRLADFKDMRMFSAFLMVLILLNLFASISILPFLKPPSDVKEVAGFMKGKDVTYLETRDFYGNWGSLNERYKDKETSFILLEQFNPGILFYRFGETADYQNLKAKFIADNDSIGCNETEYLFVYEEYAVPECYHYLLNISDYGVYRNT